MSDMTERQRMVDLLGNALQACAARGMQPPFVLCVFDADDGSPFWVATEGTEVKLDGTEHTQGAIPRNPTEIRVLDKDHVQAKIVISAVVPPTRQ
jgi:hypothetical protein